MTGNIKLRINSLAYAFYPLSEKFLLNIKRRIQCCNKRIMYNYKSVINTVCLVLFLFNYTFDLLIFFKTEFVTRHCIAVCFMAVRLILTCVKHKPPQSAEAEAVVRIS